MADLVDGLFAPEEADIIKKKKKIHLARAAFGDVLICPHSNNGKYSCKSGYRFLKEELELGVVQSSPNHDKHIWNGIWSL